MINDNDLKNEKITIKVGLPVPLWELAIYALNKGQDESHIIELLDKNPEKINSMMKIWVTDLFTEKNIDVTLKELKHDYNDSNNTTHGLAHFSVKLEGTKNVLRTIVGDDKDFLFDWNQKPASGFSDIKN